MVNNFDGLVNQELIDWILVYDCTNIIKDIIFFYNPLVKRTWIIKTYVFLFDYYTFFADYVCKIVFKNSLILEKIGKLSCSIIIPIPIILFFMIDIYFWTKFNKINYFFKTKNSMQEIFDNKKKTVFDLLFYMRYRNFKEAKYSLFYRIIRLIDYIMSICLTIVFNISFIWINCYYWVYIDVFVNITTVTAASSWTITLFLYYYLMWTLLDSLYDGWLYYFESDYNVDNNLTKAFVKYRY